MTAAQRLAEQIAEFERHHPDWDTTVTDTFVLRSRETISNGKSPSPYGMSLYVMTADGMGFEEPLQLGEFNDAALSSMCGECLGLWARS